MKAFNNLSLIIKLNIALLIVFVVLAVAVGGTLTSNLNQFSDNISERRFDEETGVIQQQLEQAEALAIADTNALANLPLVAESIQNKDESRLSSLVSDAAPTFRFDHIDVLNADGERIFDSEKTHQDTDATDHDAMADHDTEADHDAQMAEPDAESDHDMDAMPTDHKTEGDHSDFLGDDEFVQIALNGDQSTKLVKDHASEAILLAVVAPVLNDEGDVIGAIFTGRPVSDDFLAQLNFHRSDVHIGFIYEGNLVARHVAPAGHHSNHMSDPVTGMMSLAGIEIDPDHLAEAAEGDIVYTGVVENQTGIPHAVGLIPTTVGASQGIMVVEINLEALGDFRAESILNTALIMGVLGLLGVGLVAWILYSWVIRRLARLKSAAADMTAGRYDKQIPVQTKDEIGELGSAFNTLASEVQKREGQLQEINLTLEKRVKERTAELETATREAQEATRLKDEFLSVMSHELRTPLNAIMGYQGLMLMAGNLDDKNKTKVERTLANGERLLSLINDVLDISRIEAERMEFVPVDINLNEYVEKVRGQMHVLAAEKNLNFEINIASNVPSMVRMDEDALFKVINNLLGNAFKFTDHGTVSMDIGLEENQLIIRVSDTGIGIPIHMQEVIFEKFRQVDQTSKRQFGGSGLGLSIVQQIVHALGGTIDVESVPGEGSNFIAKIPVEVMREAV